MSEQWFYSRGPEPIGPVLFEQLFDLARQNHLSPSDLVWREGMPDWVAATDVPGLFSPIAPPPAVPLPPSPPLTYTPHGLPYAQPHYAAATGQSYSGEAQTAMILSIISVFCVGFVLAPIGLGLGITARKKMRASGNLEGEGMALAAIVIGGIISGIYVLLILFFMLAAALGA
jgi:hypothetical protein